MRYYRLFRVVIPHFGAGHLRVTQPFATHLSPCGLRSVRLACFMHAASVCPEPGSNSPTKQETILSDGHLRLRVRSRNRRVRAVCSCHSSAVKDRAPTSHAEMATGVMWVLMLPRMTCERQTARGQKRVRGAARAYAGLEA